jgi:regulation of enolase protein 1 (concanavalin A-like superfamily)
MNRIFILFILSLNIIPFHVSGKINTKADVIKKIKTISFSSFKSADIGVNTQPGMAKIENEQLIVNAGGADIWGTHDEGHFEYRKFKGDFDVRVQMISLFKANLYTKAGLMARTSLDDDSRHVYFQVFPDNSPRNNNNGGCEFQYRAEKGGEMKAIYPNPETAGSKFDVNFPDTWIRLKREGNVFTAYISSDNKNWYSYSTWEQQMPAKLYVGMAVTSHDASKYTTARFASFQMVK